MKTTFLFFIALNSLISTNLLAQNGEELYKANCIWCHSIGKGILVGPDLENVHNKYPEEKLIKWIRSSQSVIASGDTSAVALFLKFNKVIMPDQKLTDEEIISIIAYIKSNSASDVAASKIPEKNTSFTTKTVLPTFESGGSDTNKSQTVLNYLFAGLALLFLIIILVLAGTINTLSNKIGEGLKK